MVIFRFFILTALIAGIIGFSIAAYKDYKEDGIAFNGKIGSYIGYTLGGAVIGAILGAFTAAALASNFVASCSAVAKGAVVLYHLAKSAGLTAAGYMILDNLSNAVHNYSHVFWSGSDVAKNQAMSYAETNGGITLEMTRLGQYLEINYPYNINAWLYASQNFANQVNNYDTVRAILYYPLMRETAIWFTEQEILIEKMGEIIIGSL